MSFPGVRFLADGIRHRFVRADPDDDRLGWTACGIRFAWGHGKAKAEPSSCAECWA